MGSLCDVTPTIGALCAAGRPTDEGSVKLAADCTSTRLSKFQPSVPPRMEVEHLTRALTDPAEARDLLNGPLVIVEPGQVD